MRRADVIPPTRAERRTERLNWRLYALAILLIAAVACLALYSYDTRTDSRHLQAKVDSLKVTNADQALTGKQLAQALKRACAAGAVTGAACQTANVVAQQPLPSLPGAKGDPGTPGPAGPRGPTGAAGRTGKQGPPGKDGATGPAGPAGVAGPTGSQGATGEPGQAGAQGPIGPPGTAGEAGPQGAPGPAGSDGHDGANATPQPFAWSYTVHGPGPDRAYTVTCAWDSLAGYTCTTKES